jgi:putative tributyrin esterase
MNFPSRRVFKVTKELSVFRRAFLLALVWLALACVAPAQNRKNQKIGNSPPSLARVETFRFESKLTKREMSYRIIFPPAYSAAKKAQTRRYPAIYLLHGLTGHFDNWTDKTRLAEYAAEFDFLIVTPEGGDGWFTDSASAPDDRFESYIIEELIAEIDGKFRTAADRNNRFVAGLSMGGYGALKFGLKYPEKFALVGSFSGALDAPLRGQNHPFLRPSIISVFGAAQDSPTRKENDIFQLAREMPPAKIKDLPFIYLACGTEDAFFSTNREFAALLLDRKIPHEFRQLPGRHDWKFWDAQALEFLRLGEQFLNRAKAKAN